MEQAAGKEFLTGGANEIPKSKVNRLDEFQDYRQRPVRNVVFAEAKDDIVSFKETARLTTMHKSEIFQKSKILPEKELHCGPLRDETRLISSFINGIH